MPIPRSEIQIPDHDVLRKIGGGAYGEVWMARGVTGALRAVKIVWREDFEDERGFEREFEGILKFEPISRDHPGFVNILHVGRGSENDSPFYYYVMELGDDIHSGREINPVEYEARTLRSDLKASAGRPLDVEFCLDVGAKLSEALKHLHELDLAHRDIKPANVIFVDGKAKLADIGLVASRGQQTFVGTEGFVPPEGPGSGQADVYSLGKVLYEMATGKDRLQFPELPDRLPETANRKQWLALNRVICAVCEPRLKQRSISSAKQLSDAISKIRQGKKIREERLLSTKRWVTALTLLSAIGFALFYYKPWNFNEPISIKKPVVDTPKYKHEKCSVQFITNPLLAKVSINGLETGEETPTVFRQYAPGTKVLYKFEKPGYMTLEKEYVIPDKEYHVFPTEHLSIFLPPKENEEWVDAQGVRYFPRIGFHESGYIRENHYQQFLATKPKVDPHQVESFSERGQPIKLVLITKKTADAYARWVENQAKEKGLLHEDQYIIAKQNQSLALGPADLLEKRRAQKLFPTVLIAKDIPYAVVELSSDPVGASVFIDGEWLGVTPMETQKKIRPGKIEIVLRKDGYKAHTQMIELSDNETRKYFAKLKQNNGVVMRPDWEKDEAPYKWKNGVGVDLVQFDKNKMVAAWEVRVKDYLDFTRNTGHRASKNPGFPQTPNHPVVGVSKQDAIAYCKWLTERERKQDRIGPEHEYRLPTDVEWSQLAGLPEEKGNTPAERYLQAQLDAGMKNRYPWGAVFPPRKKVANLADAAAAKAAGVKQDRVIQGYNDGFVNTAAVGSLLPNKLGIYDISGNVYEWVLDTYSENEDLDVARGGSWASYSPHYLKSWSRFPVQKEFRDNPYGFRYVLVDKQEQGTQE